MELRKDCELVEVMYNDTRSKATLTFLDEELGQVLEVTFNKQDYDPDKKQFVDSEDKAKKVDEWCEKYFDTDFTSLTSAIGVKKDVYVYERFKSLWESEFKEVSRFDKEQKGEILQTTITDVYQDNVGIKIGYEIDDKYYETKMKYANYVEARKQWFENPQDKERQLNKFKEKFGVDISEKEKIIGKPIMVEVRMTGQWTWGDIKKPTWNK